MGIAPRPLALMAPFMTHANMSYSHTACSLAIEYGFWPRSMLYGVSTRDALHADLVVGGRAMFLPAGDSFL